ncbi:tetratricopeptide repeat protein [Billgrantia ethanolica]|uniref:Sel1 repeat family protein n=1 Tax=Billgrantia ethanolica TaxID=2733486 RepID=A0ABS8ZZ28_9GAMM|nr:tetratricopeptide repeat protein [Halomonas ethanolica]MCE8001862.1 sel1 repeat family protein [Halomonas ethanolica]
MSPFPLITVTVLALSSLMIPTALALDEEAQVAKDEGMRLWGIHQWIKMQPYLEQAAEYGDVESMYYLGEANRLLSRGLSLAALEWYHRAAQLGEPHAMLRLYDGSACELGDVCPEDGNDWREAALVATLPKAEAGDAEAMGALYDIYTYLDRHDEAMEWLLLSAEAGNLDSMNWLGQLARDDEENYATEPERLEAAAEWYRRAAEADYVPAIHNLSLVLLQLEQSQEAWEWMQIASDEGHIDARLGIGWCYLEPERDALCKNEKDVVKGLGMLTALVQATNMEMINPLINDFKQKLGEEQLIESEAVAERWLVKEPPLSHFPDKFGF